MVGSFRGLGRRQMWHLTLATVVLLVAGGRELVAHNITPDPTVEVFLTSARDRLAVKVWLPMIALADANLPRTADGHFNRNEIRAALDVVARGIARDLELQHGDNPLSAPTVATTLSPDESFVAIDLDYPSPASRADLSGRFHTFRGAGQLIATQVHFVVDDRRTRTFIVDGPPQRIVFAPGVLQVLQHFLNIGSVVLFEDTDFLLLAICLIAVAHASQTMIRAVVALIAGQAIVVGLAAVGLLAVSPTVLAVSAGLAASAIVVVAIQDVTSPQSRWLPMLMLAFGLLSGAALGGRVLREWGFSGAHPLAGLVGFLATVSIGEIWSIALLWSAAGLVRRRGRIAELAVLSTAIFAGHAALHRIADQGQALADAGTFSLDRFLFTVTIGWGLLILIAGIVGTLWPAKAIGDSPFGSRNLEAQ